MTSDAVLAAEMRPVRNGQIFAWGLWDWGSSGFNTVIVTFVFSVYLTDSVGKNLPGSIDAVTWYSWSVAAAGVLIAVLAPVSGQQADAGGRRKRSLGLFSALVFACMLGMFFVHDEYSYFWLGAVLIGLGSVFFEIGTVFYNSMLRQISTPANVGRVSGFGWSMGYFGGIFLLLLAYFGFISGDGDTRGFFGVPAADGLDIRIVALVAAAWFGICAVPVLFAIPEIPAGPARERRSIAAAYRKLFHDIAELYRTDRQIALFLLAQAIFRDGLAAVFHFGAILAVSVYGFTSGNVLIFGVAANIVAALGALGLGVLDDRLGPKRVVIISLIGLLIAGTAVIFVSGSGMFWVFGLILCLFVGPAQSAARTYMARMIPPGREGQLFGLYTTTGRAVSFLSPALFGLCVTIFGGQRYGTIGIMIVLAVGLVLLLRVPPPRDTIDGRIAGSPVGATAGPH